MNNTNPYTELVIRYIGDQLKPEEKKKFEADLLINGLLKEEYENQKVMNTMLADETLHNLYDTVNNVEEELEKEEIGRRRRMYIWYGAAASVLILFTLSFLLPITRKDGIGETLYAENYKTASSIVSNRSVPEDLLPLETALKAYDKLQFSNSSQLFEEHLKTEPKNISAQFYLGLSYMELNKIEDAILHLKLFTELETNVYSDQAHWYLALCYLKIENMNEAKVILNQIVAKSQFQKENAKAILKQLE